MAKYVLFGDSRKMESSVYKTGDRKRELSLDQEKSLFSPLCFLLEVKE